MRDFKYYALVFLIFSGCANDVDSTVSELDNLGVFVRRNSTDPSGISLLAGAELPLKDSDLKCLAKLPSIQGIDFQNTQLTGSFLEYLKRPEALEILQLWFCPITTDGLRNLRRLKGLQELGLMGPPYISNVEMEFVASLKSLRILQITAAQIDDAGLKQILGLTNLEELGISYTRVGAKGISSVNILGKLKKLHLGGLHGINEGIKGLAGNNSIEELSLNNSDFNDSGTDSIRKIKSLKALRIPLCAVTDSGLEQLCKVHTLRELDIGGTKITDMSVDSLKELKDIEMIDFGNNSLVTDKAIEQLMKLLPRAKIYWIAPTKPT